MLWALSTSVVTTTSRWSEVPESFRTTSHLLGLVTLVGRLSQERVNLSLDDLGLTFPKAVTLVRLWRSSDGVVPQSALIESLAVSRAFGSQLLADLEHRKLITRRVDDVDARRQVVELTETGKALEDPVFEIFDWAEEMLLDGVSYEQRVACHDVLRSMLENGRSGEDH